MFNTNGSFLIALFEFFLVFAGFMCLFGIMGDIFRSNDLGAVARPLWVLFVIFIPWMGILVYLIGRGKGIQDRQLERREESSGPKLSTSSPLPAGAPTNPADQISSAKSLLDREAITRAEFETRKEKAIDT